MGGNQNVTAAPPAGGIRQWRVVAPLGVLERSAQLVALWGLAVVDPLFQVLHDASYLPEHGWTPLEIVLYEVSWLLLPPLILLLIELTLEARRSTWAQWTHVVFIGILGGLWLGYTVKQDSPGSGGLITLALVGGTFAVIALFVRFQAARWFATALVVAPVISVVSLATGGFTYPPLDRTPVYGLPLRNGPPVVLIVLDELPLSSLLDATGRVDGRRLPAFARVARDATWYVNATANADETIRAVPAIMTGIATAREDGPPAGNVLTLLGRRYRVNAEEPAVVCPATVCHEKTLPALPERAVSELSVLQRLAVTQHLPRAVVDRLFAARRDTTGRYLREEKARRFERNFSGDGNGVSRPSLNYLHILLPHNPWIRVPDGRIYRPGLQEDAWLPNVTRDPVTGLVAGNETWASNSTLVALAYQAHLAQLGATDRVLGRLITGLRRTGLYDRALVIVTADHGANFVPGQHFRQVNSANEAAILNIPLFVKFPGQHRRRISRSFARAVDILPTIARAVQVRVPWHVDGKPLGGLRRFPTRAKVYSVYRHETVTFRPTRLEVERRRLVKREARLFGRAKNTLDVWAVGPRPSLRGHRPTRVRGLVPLRARIDQSAQLQRAAATRGFVAASISGELPSLGPSMQLAVAVNGRIAATTTSYHYAGKTRFGALLPPRTLRRVGNKLAIYAIR